MDWRKFQQEGNKLFERSAQVGRLPRQILAEIICGGGKSILALMFINHALRRMRVANKAVWVVPNGTLREQAAEEFLTRGDRASQAALALGVDFELIENDNNAPLDKGKAGYVTTPHAILAQPDLHLDYFARNRCVLVLDEAHHFAGKKAFAEAIDPLVSRSISTLMMSGKFERHDRRALKWFPYILGATGRFVLDTDPAPDRAWIIYKHGDALRERAIIPTEFFKLDGHARWEDKYGHEQERRTLGISRKAIFTALNTEYSEELVRRCYVHWKGWLRTNSASKVLVVCASVVQARRIFAWFRSQGENRVRIATYENVEQANSSIRAFRRDDDIKILITVNKAYEGLDCRAITHLAVLTHIRSYSWILQNLGRGWRFDPNCGLPWEKQRSFAWVPDDDRMNKIISLIEAEQSAWAIGLDPDDDDDSPPSDGTQPTPDEKDYIIPKESIVTSERAAAIGEQSMPEMDAARTAFYRDVMEKTGVGHSIYEVHKVLSAFNCVPVVPSDYFRTPSLGPGKPRPVVDVDVPPDGTAGERLKWLKSKLNSLVSGVAGGEPEMIKHINVLLARRFCCRDAMTEELLMAACSAVRSMGITGTIA